MSWRSSLSGLFADLSDRLDDGKPSPDPALPVDPDYRLQAWSAQVHQKSMSVGPWLASAGAIALVLGLVKFWQIATRPTHGSVSNAASNAAENPEPQAAEVAKKLEEGLKVKQMKQELGGDVAPAAFALPPMPPPYQSTPSPLVYFFPRGDTYGAFMPYSSPRSVSIPAHRWGVVYDPGWAAVQRYEPVFQVGGGSDVRTDDSGHSQNGGPVWRDGRMTRRNP